MLTKQKVLEVIMDCETENLYPTELGYLQKKEFALVSYNLSGLEALYYYILNYKGENMLEAVESFRQMVNDFSCEAGINNPAGYIFSIYYDIASYILDLIIQM